VAPVLADHLTQILEPLAASDPPPVEVSVVVPAYRGAATIVATLDAIGRATAGRPCEIIVVESSGDGTADLVRRRRPDAVVVESTNRLSAGGARNRGIDVARGRLIVFTDQDCIVPDDWLAALERHFDDPAVGAAGGAVGIANPDNLSGCAVYFLEFLTHFPHRQAAQRNVNFLVGCNSAYRADVLARVRFPEQTLGEDILFSHRVQKTGCDVVYDSKIEVRHHNREGWREFLRYNRKMGEAAAHYHAVLRRPAMVPFLSFPLLMFCAPVFVLPSIAWRLARSRWSYFWRFVALSPACLVGNLVWAAAFVRAVRAAPRHPGRQDAS
jgi:GT2 family glycosyltransferase